MAFGRSPEEKHAETQRLAALSRKRTQALEAAKSREAASITDPVEQARRAQHDGQGFLEVQLQVGYSQRDARYFGGGSEATDARTHSHAGTLSAIEAIGWKLEHVGYVFVVTGENSRGNFLVSGQNVAVSGETIGIYLFRNTDPA